jgi:hypothetical protein
MRSKARWIEDGMTSKCCCCLEKGNYLNKTIQNWLKMEVRSQEIVKSRNVYENFADTFCWGVSR